MSRISTEGAVERVTYTRLSETHQTFYTALCLLFFDLRPGVSSV